MHELQRHPFPILEGERIENFRVHCCFAVPAGGRHNI